MLHQISRLLKVSNVEQSQGPGSAAWSRLGQLSIEQLADLVPNIGDTPVRRLEFTVDAGRTAELVLKLEGFNPGGSIKDRTALRLFAGLREQGRLKPGDTVVESTSGNLGVALAYLARVFGHRFHAVVDPHITAENLRVLTSLGAQVDIVDQPDEHGSFLPARLARVQELCSAHSHYVWTNQYGSGLNPLAHYATTAPEIDTQCGQRLQAVIAAVSTGGTLAGLARYFREHRPDVLVVAVDVIGSSALGGPLGPRRLNGIGSSRPSEFLGNWSYDEVVYVSDLDAVTSCHELWNRTGIKVGASSGAAIAAAAHLLARRELTQIACICPDDGTKYDASIYQPEWLAKAGLDVVNSSAPFSVIRTAEPSGSRSDPAPRTLAR